MKRLLKPGFSILEAIIVVIFIGILASVAVYSLNLTRQSSRDEKRVSDVSVMRAALTQFWLQKATYPMSAAVSLGKPGAGVDKLTGDGFVPASTNSSPVYLQAIPQAPNAGEYYVYHGSATGYSIKFTTERATAYGAAGTWYGHASGVDKVDAEK